MKMLITSTIAENRNIIEDFFSKHNVSLYNEFELKSVDKSGKPEHRVGNWFAADKSPYNHIAFYTIIADEQATSLMADLEKCKNEQPECKVHAYIINIEKGI